MEAKISPKEQAEQIVSDWEVVDDGRDYTLAIEDAVEEAHGHLTKLLEAANHNPGCAFGPCTCGKATEHSNAQLDANKYLREHK